MNHPIVAFLPTMAAASALAPGVAAGYANLTKEKKELVVQVEELKAEKVEIDRESFFIVGLHSCHRVGHLGELKLEGERGKKERFLVVKSSGIHSIFCTNY